MALETTGPVRPCVVFDLGGVLLRPEGPAAELARVLGVQVEAVLGPYWRHRDDYDRGGPPSAFWGALRRDLVAAGLEPADVGDDELDLVDASGWAQLADGSAELLADLERAGTVTAVLSNAPASLARTVRAAGWSGGFSQLVFSCDLGRMKPEAEVYEQVERRTARPPQELLFFDDRPPNVEGAAQQGWQAHVWTGLGPARQVLTAAGALSG
jgi:putative hydrolase of the HAD superfamily